LKAHPGLTKNSRIEKIKIFHFGIWSFFSSKSFFEKSIIFATRGFTLIYFWNCNTEVKC
jgi:hypothetical protein